MYKVFIVDDDVRVKSALREIIVKKELPFKIIGQSSNGEIVLEEIEKKKPDILFTEVSMPGYNGLELLKYTGEKESDMKVVFISQCTEFEYVRSAFLMGAFDYILKPIEMNTLHIVLERVLDKDRIITVHNENEEMNVFVIEQIIQEIKQSYTENITLTNLSEKYGISISHLSSLLKEQLGLPFSQYITCKRIEKAKELLVYERLSIGEIAELVGYNDYFYFSKVFKKNTGISPSKYRSYALKKFYYTENITKIQK